MNHEELFQFRIKIYHSHAEFAALLSDLRGIQVSHRTVEGWERGRGVRPIPVYQTDIAAIKEATRPHLDVCEQCDEEAAVVRKGDLDLCADCATPHNGAARWPTEVGR